MGDYVRVRSNRDGAPALASSTSMCSEAKRRDVTSWQPPLPTASHAISERLNPAQCLGLLQGRAAPIATINTAHQRFQGSSSPRSTAWLGHYLVGLDDFSGFRRRDSRRSIPRTEADITPACVQRCSRGSGFVLWHSAELEAPQI